ncbi:hypothetical protein G6L96_008830 [Agrobacterium tumefaciens]|uniref:hypothetical protein n=1 Tax=Agrobacterium tumefaciens TaxID=358 RepID=UPI0015740C8F|nr:hypothetical protein [Agrobacterium tumefaciens]WCK69894.1 hypothetical protein G6L96_008830 [Agrobacterium tumefaciens]
MFRKVLLCSLALAFGVGSAAAQGVTVKSKRPVSDGWFPNEHLVVIERSGYIYSERRGKTSEGYDYWISPQAAQIETGRQTWGASCKLDAMDDKTYCTLILIDKMKASIALSDMGEPSTLCLYFSDFTPAPGMVRIDKLVAEQTDRQGCMPLQAAGAITTGKSILIHTDQMGPDYQFEHQLSLDGYKQASHLVAHLRANMGSLSFD